MALIFRFFFRILSVQTLKCQAPNTPLGDATFLKLLTIHTISPLMLKKLLLRQLALLLFVALSVQSAFSQTFWTETFNSGAAFSAWTSANVGTGTEQWQRSTDPSVNFGFTNAIKAFSSPTAADGFAFFNSDANGEAKPHVATLTSAPINCASQTSVRIRFHSQYAAANQDAAAEVRVSSDGGATWASYPVLGSLWGFPFNQGQLVPADVVTEIPIPAANGKSAVLLQFRWTGEWEYGWKIDDIELYNFVAPKVDVTFKVNLATTTPSPEGARLAGTFNGFSDDLMTNEGNGVWSITKSLSVGDTIRYKFKNGSGGWEPGQSACGVNDGFGGFNRIFVVKGDITLPTVCFNACSDCVVPCASNPANSIICDNIDSYNTAQRIGPQSPHWTTWSGTEGGTEDGTVSTEQAASGTKSLKVLATLAGGGPMDVVLNLGNKSTGHYSLKWKMYVPLNKKAYYNFQEVLPIPNPNPNGNWNLDVFFEANGAARCTVETVNKFAFTYPYDKWFTIEHVVDLDNNILTYLVDGKIAGKIAYPDKLGGVDFFGIDNTHLFYVDDVEYVTLPAATFNADICDKAVDLSLYFGQAAGVTQSTPSYDNTNATASPYDPEVDCWSEDANAAGDDLIDNSLWFTFVGDGNRYRIETDSCSTKFISGGDTQMAIYEGPNCLNLTLSACNDDIDAQANNFRSGIDIETESGKTYFIMVDGYNFLGSVSRGEFCFKITQVPSVLCADGEVGTFEIANNGAICFGTNLNEILEPDAASIIIPNQGPYFGMAWCLSVAPLDPNVWPGTLPPSECVYTGLIANVFKISLLNDGTSGLNPGVYYLTPVVAGGAEKIDPNGDSFLDNFDVSNGCFYMGESKRFLLLPELTALDAIADITKETVPPGNNGKIDLQPTGGFPELAQDPTLYSFTWSNGGTTEDLAGLAAGTYTVTITDPTNCTDPVSLSFTVTKTSGTEDPASVKSLNVTPNPTSGTAQLNLTLASAAEVRIELTNALGQVLQTLHAGQVSVFTQPLDLSTMVSGSYFLRVTVDGETAVRRIVVQK